MKHASAFLELVEQVKPNIREVNTDQVKAMIDSAETFTLIDVREDSEWAKGHIVGAVHMGRGVIERDIEKAVPAKDTLLVLYCGGGFRSALAAESLQKMGYTNVFSIKGGYKGMVQAQWPVQTVKA